MSTGAGSGPAFDKGTSVRAVAIATIIAAVAYVPSGAAQTSSKKKSSTNIAPAGDGQTIRVGKTVIARPFGAELVDRLVIAGSYNLRGRRVHLVRGDASGPCPSRFVFVSEQPGGSQTTSGSFGTCSGSARVNPSATGLVVAMPAAPAGGPTVRFVFDGATVRALDAIAAAGNATAQPGCVPASRTDYPTQVDAVAAVERDYPQEYRKTGTLKAVSIDPEELRSLVGALACLSSWPAAENRIPELATPLFVSRRHGPAAFAALDSIAHDPASDAHLRAMARSFAAEMSYRVDRREPTL